MVKFQLPFSFLTLIVFTVGYVNAFQSGVTKTSIPWRQQQHDDCNKKCLVTLVGKFSLSSTGYVSSMRPLYYYRERRQSHQHRSMKQLSATNGVNGGGDDTNQSNNQSNEQNTSPPSITSSSSLGKKLPEERPPKPFFYGVMGALYYIPIRYMSPQYKNLSAMSLAFYFFGRAILVLDSKWFNKLVLPMIPSPLPAKPTGYALTIAETLVGLLLLFFPQYQSLAGKLAVGVLAANTPLCIYHVCSKKVQKETGIGFKMALVRLIFQGIFFHWANWFAMPWWWTLPPVDVSII